METLERPIKVNGQKVEVPVYPDNEGGWLLEVVDALGDATCWEKPFASAELAFAEVTRVIDEGVLRRSSAVETRSTNPVSLCQ